MKVLVVDTYYPAFLQSHYALDSARADLPYAEQLRLLIGQAFGTSDFYSRNLTALGCEAAEVIANCGPLQSRWISEHRRRSPLALAASLSVRLPRLQRLWRERVLYQQIKAFRPDVVHFQDPLTTSRPFRAALRSFVPAVTCQIASPIGARGDFREFDLVLSSLPGFVARFRAAGLESELFRLGFEESLATRVPASAARTDVVFVGSVSPGHSARRTLLDAVAGTGRLKWWGQGVQHVERGSALARAFQGPAWGLDMYKRLATSAIVLNQHIDIAGRDANNMRLYEATGMGALLLTDNKPNLPSLFDPAREVVAYDNLDDCLEKIDYLLSRPDVCREIASAGKKRTLLEHTYRLRMQEFLDLVAPRLRAAGTAS